MSFLGSIGHLMEGSGLREALESVYAANTVSHMMSGHAYSRALRGHTLVISALMITILEPYVSSLDGNQLDCLLKSSEESYSHQAAILELQVWYNQRVNELKLKSRTGYLWTSYVQYVLLILQLIRAERTNDWESHRIVTKKCPTCLPRPVIIIMPNLRGCTIEVR